MNKKLISLLFFLSTIISCWAIDAKGKWITSSDPHVNDPNTWVAFRKDIRLTKIPKDFIAQIAVDSKYWLWINGKMVVFEGGLKRGPNPTDSYYDEINITPYLKKGENQLAILVWYFGKEGFSHKSSGKCGLLFQAVKNDIKIISDQTWKCRIHPAYGTAKGDKPNFRLPESNISFNANLDISDWQQNNYNAIGNKFCAAVECGQWGDAPWNDLIKRPIPQWKNFGVKEFSKIQRIKGKINNCDTIIADLPYNLQMTPLIDVTDEIGNYKIDILTDNTYAAGDINLRTEYITKKGHQQYESYGWMNGHKVYFIVPNHLKINKLAYRETGYNTEMSGHFACDDNFYNRFWKKALNTLYINMRDTYFDCPERERAQWWGDVTILMGECFYTTSTSTHALMRKGIHELIAWQKKDGSIFSPIPAGNYDNELPGQMLASIGYYGFWNYYMNTGDKQTIEDIYPGVKKYLNIWTLDESGLTGFRSGGWTWGDWGDNRDIRLILSGWHYLALKGAINMAHLLNKENDIPNYETQMQHIKNAYNTCWNGYAYRHPSYQDKTDDRVQALAVISGIADSSKYPNITQFLKNNFHASPYMEKYIMEALFQMGEGEYAMKRAEKRFSPMVNNTTYTTLFEGWDIGSDGFGGGTVNHAWSGGPLIVISQYLCGIYPIEAGYKTFKVSPNPVRFNRATITIPTIAGEITAAYLKNKNEFKLEVNVPKGTEAIIELPITQGEIIIRKNNKIQKGVICQKNLQNPLKNSYRVGEGQYTFITK